MKNLTIIMVLGACWFNSAFWKALLSFFFENWKTLLSEKSKKVAN
jgi:hypothetical protein